MPDLDLAGSASRWLAEQDQRAVRIAAEVIARRAAYREVRESDRMHESGVIYGLRLALSYLGDRPGDISDTGAEGFISEVEAADRYAALLSHYVRAYPDHWFTWARLRPRENTEGVTLSLATAEVDRTHFYTPTTRQEA